MVSIIPTKNQLFLLQVTARCHLIPTTSTSNYQSGNDSYVTRTRKRRAIGWTRKIVAWKHYIGRSVPEMERIKTHHSKIVSMWERPFRPHPRRESLLQLWRGLLSRPWSN